MVWFKVDDGFYSSKKVLSIPRTHRLAAVGLWTMAGNWSGRELSDGRVPEYVLAELGATPRLRQALVEARLWLDRGSAGVEFHSWADYQPTRTEVEAERAKTAERQRKWRDRQNPVTRDESVSNAVTDTVTNTVTNGAPPRPDPTRPIEGSKDPSPKARETNLPKDWSPTAEHIKRAKEAGINVLDEAENFRLHAETHDRRAVSWNAAFTTWIKKARPKNVAPVKRVATNDEWMYR